MYASEFTIDSLPRLLKDAALRRALQEEMRRESGSFLPLKNRVSEIARQCLLAADELDAIAGALLSEDDAGRILDALVFHPKMPDETLARILDAGRCINALGHRSGPEWLLLRLARERQYPEAILTLALYDYGPAEGDDAPFLDFVREYLHVEWLRESIRKSHAAKKIPEQRRAAALRMIDDYEVAHPPPPRKRR